MSDESTEKPAPDEQEIIFVQETNLFDWQNGQNGEEIFDETPAGVAEEQNISEPFISLDDDALFGEPENAEDVELAPDVKIQGDFEKVLRENLEQIKNAQTALARDFSTKIKYDATKQGQIDKLYQENQSYRDDVIEKFKQQVVLAVIEQIDDAEKQIAHFDKQEETEKNYAKLLNCFRDVTVSFQDMLLERFDVSSFQCDPGTPFDPKRQRALKTSDSPEASQNKTVAATLRPGYEKNDGTVVRPEMVEVLRFNPVGASPSANSPLAT